MDISRESEEWGDRVGRLIMSLPEELREDALLEVMSPLLSLMPIDKLEELKVHIQTLEPQDHPFIKAALTLIDGQIEVRRARE